MYVFFKKLIIKNKFLYNLSTYILRQFQKKTLYQKPQEANEIQIFNRNFYYPKNSLMYKEFFRSFNDKYKKGLEFQYVALKKKFDFEKVDSIIDIGSNIGYQALFYHYFFKKEIICFEPSSINFFFLKKNLSDIKDIKIYNFALGDKDEKLNLSIPNFEKHNPSNFGLFTLKKDVLSNIFKEEVLVKNFDKLELRKQYKKNYYIKIDVEGFELNVLNGMKNFARNNNCYFKIELNKKYFHAENVQEILNFFTDLNYYAYIIDKKEKNVYQVNFDKLQSVLKSNTYEVFFADN
jgi:FkbM family methyltransferase